MRVGEGSGLCGFEGNFNSERSTFIDQVYKMENQKLTLECFQKFVFAISQLKQKNK